MNDRRHRLLNVIMIGLSLLEMGWLQRAAGVNWLEPFTASLLQYSPLQIAVILGTVAGYVLLPGVHWWAFKRLEGWLMNRRGRVEAGGLTDAEYEETIIERDPR